MIQKHLPDPAGLQLGKQIRVVRHRQVCEQIQVSSSQLFAMVAKGLFPKPFTLVPGGRAVGWLCSDVEDWLLARSKAGSNQ